MAYTLIAKWTAREGSEDQVREHILALVEPSRAEPGNLLYQPHVDLENPRVFVVYEQYVDEGGYEAHQATPHFERWVKGVAIPNLESRERAFYQTMDVD